MGDGARALIERALPCEAKSEETITACLQTYLTRYKRNRNQHTRRYEGTEELLDALADMDISLAILSNKPHDFTQSCVETFLNRWHFDPILGQKAGIPKKPDPTGARRIMRRFRLAAEHVVYVGDSGVDMKTAVNAGIYPVGSVWGFRSAEELSEAGARTLIHAPPDLLRLLHP